MKTVCMSCGAHVRGPKDDQGPVSHGYCEPCGAIAKATAESQRDIEHLKNKVQLLEAELSLMERERDHARVGEALAIKLAETRANRVAEAEKRCKSLEESCRRLLAERDA